MFFKEKIIPLILILNLIFIDPKSSYARSVPLASIAVNAHNGLVIKANNADQLTYPASLTKVMTLYMVFEALEKGWLTEEQSLTVSKNASQKPSSKLWLKPGTVISVKDAIAAIVTRSANDVATAIAETLGQTEENFAEMMTTVAKELGMKNTIFKNASGLHHRKQVTTARDMALLAMAIWQHFPQYYHFFSLQEFELNEQKCFNHNRLLRTYNGVDGIKTGYVSASGFNLMTSAQKGEHRIIAVVMGRNNTSQRDRDMTNILDKSFRELILSPENIPIPTSKPNLETPYKKYHFKPLKN